MYMVTTNFMKILNFLEIFEIFEILKLCENFEILYLKIFTFFILEFRHFLKILKFNEN